MSNFPVPPAVPEAPKGPNGLLLFARMFDEPTMVFKEVTQRPRLAAPLLLLALVFVIRAFAIPADVLRADTNKGFDIAEKLAPGKITPEIRQAALDQATSTGARAKSAVFGSIAGIAGTALIAVILWGVFSLAGAELSFGQEYSLVLYGGAPVLLGVLVVLAMTPITHSSTFSLGLGFAMSSDASPFLHAFLAQVTVFTVWQLYLLSLGHQIVRKAKTIGGSMSIVVGLWLCAAVVGAFFAGKFGALS
jgi:hypothetical protein